jgi:hypothetical protein
MLRLLVTIGLTASMVAVVWTLMHPVHEYKDKPVWIVCGLFVLAFFALSVG